MLIIEYDSSYEKKCYVNVSRSYEKKCHVNVSRSYEKKCHVNVSDFECSPRQALDEVT